MPLRRAAEIDETWTRVGAFATHRRPGIRGEDGKPMPATARGWIAGITAENRRTKGVTYPYAACLELRDDTNAVMTWRDPADAAQSSFPASLICDADPEALTTTIHFPVDLRVHSKECCPEGDVGEPLKSKTDARLEAVSGPRLAAHLLTGKVRDNWTHPQKAFANAHAAVDQNAALTLPKQSLTRAIDILQQVASDSPTGYEDHVLHVPRHVLVHLASKGLLDTEGDKLYLEGGQQIVADVGYGRGVKPTGAAIDVDYATTWIYYSGPVEYDLSDIEGTNTRCEEAVVYEYRARRQGICRFNPDAVWAMAVDLTIS